MATAPADLGPNEALVPCAAREAVSLVSNKWTPLVVFLLAQRTHRFNELRRRIDGISQKVLTQTLRRLEAAECVQRTIHPTVPVTVEYSLTPLGETLVGPLTAIIEWAHANAPACGFVDDPEGSVPGSD